MVAEKQLSLIRTVVDKNTKMNKLFKEIFSRELLIFEDS